MAPRRVRVLGQQGDQGNHAQALHRHLIQVTQRLLAAHGLAGLTTRSIAREAQVADGVLYNHFADKDDLVVSALVERLTELGAEFATARPRAGGQDLRTGLTVLIVECRRFQVDAFPLVAGLLGRPDLMHALFTRLHTTGGHMPPLVWGDILDYLTGEQRLGTISADVSSETIASVIFGASQLDTLRRPMTWGAREPDVDPGHDEVADLVETLVRACRP